MNQIVVTGIFSFPNGEAASKRIRNISVSFKNFGYQPYVFSTSGHISGELFNIKGQKFFKTNDDIFFLPLQKVFKNELKFGRRILSNFFYPMMIISLGLKTSIFAKKINSRVIYVYGRSYLLAISLFFFKWAFNKNVKIITDVTEPPYDYHYQKLINPFKWQKLLVNAMRIKLLDSLLFFRVLNLFDIVVFISFGLKDAYGNNVKRSVVIPSVVNVGNTKIDIWPNLPYPCKTKLNIIYLGAFYEKDDPKNMFNVLSSLKDSLENFEIWLVGKFTNLESDYWIPQYTVSFGDRVKVFFSPSDERVKDLINMSSFLVCLRKEDDLQHFTFPTRVVEALENGVPIITNAYGDIALYFKNSENAILVDSKYYNQGDYLSRMLVTYLDGNNYSNLCASSKELLHASFSAESHVKKLLDLIRSS